MLDSLPLGHSYNHSHSTVTATCSSSLLTPCTQRRFVKQDDRKRALVSRLLQYSLVRHVLLIPFRQINICRTPEGKPYLVPLHTLWPIIIPTIIHHRSLQLHPISSEPFCLSAWSVAFSHWSLLDWFISRQKNCSAFPNFNFNTSHQGDYVGIASEPLCLVGLDIVSVSKPQGETTTEFISNFSSYLTEHEWDCIVRAGTPAQVLMEFYRYSILFLLEF